MPSESQKRSVGKPVVGVRVRETAAMDMIQKEGKNRKGEISNK
jgi:hypothetical protein